VCIEARRMYVLCVSCMPCEICKTRCFRPTKTAVLCKNDGPQSLVSYVRRGCGTVASIVVWNLHIARYTPCLLINTRFLPWNIDDSIQEAMLCRAPKSLTRNYRDE
jgi:hypothetical protein